MATFEHARPRTFNRPPFPPSLLGYGALYAFGYTVWETSALSTQAVVGGSYDASWLASALVVPLALLAIVVWARRHPDAAPGRAWYAAAPLLGVAGSVLSVVYQHVASPGLALALAVASGLGTAVASALFIVLWGLAFARFSSGVLEAAIPLSFTVTLLCSLVVPAMPQVPALVVALILVALCSLTLRDTRRKLAEGAVSADFLEEKPSPPAVPQDGPLAIARILAYGVAAWALCSFAPCLGSAGRGGSAGGIDVVSAVGYCVAIVYARCIIRYAVRVDFLALASMTLAPFVLSVALYAFPGQAAQTVASVLNVAMSACFEIILLIYFVRVAQRQSGNRALWLALGSCAGYLGVLIGQLAAVLFAREAATAADKPLWCLGVVCAYAFALALVPQRRPYEPEAVSQAENPTSQGSSTAQALVTAAPTSAPTLATPATAARRVEGPAPGCAQADKVARATAEARPLPGALAPDASRPNAIDRACAGLAAEHGLSSREAQICGYLARGRSQTYIRDALFLSKNTVATHVRHLYTKLDVHSKQELIDLVEKHR